MLTPLSPNVFANCFYGFQSQDCLKMELTDYLQAIASQLVKELEPILSIREVTANSDLLGEYAEAAIRSLVARTVQPMNVCTGAVLDHPMPPALRQVDIIVWAPFPAPAIFNVGGFGLVPRSSVFGVLEIKRSNYSRTDDQLESFIEDVQQRRIVSNAQVSGIDFARRPGLGVVSVLENVPSARLQRLIDSRQVVAIFEKTDGSISVRSKDVMVLVNFLQFVTWRYRIHSSGPTFPEIDVNLLPR